MYTVHAFSLLRFAASSVCCADYSQMIGPAVLCLVVSEVLVMAVSDVLMIAVSEVWWMVACVRCSGTLSVVW